MLSIHSFWYLGLMVASTLTVLFIGKYKSDKLPPKRKELRMLGYSFVAFAIILGFLLTSLPLFSGYDYFPQEVKDMEEAQRILQDQSKSLKELRSNLTDFRDVTYFFLLFFGMFVLQPVYNFAKAITPVDPVEKKKVLNLDVE